MSHAAIDKSIKNHQDRVMIIRIIEKNVCKALSFDSWQLNFENA